VSPYGGSRLGSTCTRTVTRPLSSPRAPSQSGTSRCTPAAPGESSTRARVPEPSWCTVKHVRSRSSASSLIAYACQVVATRPVARAAAIRPRSHSVAALASACTSRAATAASSAVGAGTSSSRSTSR
jgi:hypothetical protein